MKLSATVKEAVADAEIEISQDEVLQSALGLVASSVSRSAYAEGAWTATVY